MVADTQVTYAGQAVQGYNKLKAIGEGLVGFSGPTMARDRSFELVTVLLTSSAVAAGDHHWAEAAASLSEDVDLLVAPRRGSVWLLSRDSLLWIEEGYYAIGTGALVALGALDAGATPSAAVRFASKRDAYTGPNVTTLRH